MNKKIQVMNYVVVFQLLLSFLFSGCTQNYASYDGGNISKDEVEKSTEKKIEQLRAQIGEVQRQAANELLFKRLIKKDAKGAKVQKYFADYINRQKGAIPDSYARKYILLNTPQSKDILPQDIQRAKRAIVSDKLNVYRNLLSLELNEKYNVKLANKKVIDLTNRKKIQLKSLPFRGPENAPVTIVEFSDFQCPYCRRAYNVLKEVMKKYKGKIRWVYADFPLGFHKLAKPAAMAAKCAEEQNKFWDFHDALFIKKKLTSMNDIHHIAKIIELNINTFQGCFKSNKYSKAVDREMAMGQKLGVSGTPAFFINGRFFSGAIPLAEFVDQLAAEGI